MIGTVLSMKYEVLEQIDEGPIFTFYRATDRQLHRDLYVRTLLPKFRAIPAFVEALHESIPALSSIQGPHIEHFLEMGEDDGEPFIVSEAPPGQKLSERIARLAPYSIPVCISLTIQMLEALSVVHAKGFAHGEVTSRSVLVGADGKVTLLQAGLWTTYAASPVVASNILPDIAPYLAPEVSQGRMPSPQSDVYGIGVILFELLTARTPFSADSPSALAQKHMTAPVPNIRQINSAVPAVLDEILRKALSKDTGYRYTNAKGMLNDMRQLQEAMRLGKTLTWPLNEVSAPAAAAVPGMTEQPKPSPQSSLLKSAAPAPAAPAPKKREQPKEPVSRPKERKIRQQESTDKLPAWLTVPVYITGMCVLLLVCGYIYFNITKPKAVSVPNLIGTEAASAEATLKHLGLTMDIRRKEYNDKVPQGQIISTNPRAGERARENSFVAAVVSAGPRMIAVPELRGLGLDDARKLLQAADLELDSDIMEDEKRGAKLGSIIEQIPEAKTKVQRKTRVRLTVASNRSRGPQSRTEAEYELFIQMPSGLDKAFVRVDIVDLKGTRTVYSEKEHHAGDSFYVTSWGKGDPVYFKVFFDGRLVKQVSAKPLKTGQVQGG